MKVGREVSLWIRVGVPFLVLATAGSLALLGIQHSAVEREAQAALTNIARSNAEFLRQTQFPPSAQLARNLSRMLDAQVVFRWQQRFLPEPTTRTERDRLAQLAAGPRASRFDADRQAIAVAIDPETDLIVLRRDLAPFASLRRPGFLLSLLVLWTTVLGLAWVVTRGVVRPLRAQALLGRMSTGLAHEIHNPLAAIRLHTQLLGTTPAGELPQAVSAALPHLLGATQTIESLVNQWQFLARPEPPQTTPTALRPLIEQALGTLAPALERAGVRVELTAPAEVTVDLDRRRIGQVLHNLLLNALQAMGNGGHLQIDVRATDERVAVSIADSGPGFSAVALRRHAELFFSEKEGGMGVGLAVCAGVLHAHGGALRVANRPAGGAVVTLELPRRWAENG